MKKISKKKKNIIIVVSVVLCALIAASGVFFFVYNGMDYLKGDADELKQPEKHKVTFYKNVGVDVLEEVDVRDGKTAAMPDVSDIESDEVFLGWSRIPYKVNKDIPVYPNFNDISEYKNVICADAVYVESGDKLKIKYYIKGQVNFDEIDMKIEYNSDLLEFSKCKKEVSKLDCVNENEVKEDLGQLTIKLNNKKNITENDVLFELMFDVVGETGLYTELVTTVNKVLFTNDDGEKLKSDFAVINGKVYIL